MINHRRARTQWEYSFLYNRFYRYVPHYRGSTAGEPPEFIEWRLEWR